MRFASIRKLGAFLCLLMLVSDARAASFSARISEILLYEGGNLVYIYVEGGTQGRPACAGSNGDYLSFSMNRPRAREYLAALMMAFAAGKRVHFWTKGACVDQSFSDTIDYILVSNL